MKTEKRLMRIPAMMITSERDLRLMSDSFSAGAALFLHKPFTAEHLQSTVRILLSTAGPARKAA
jgi:PleD family two-component response regulator